MLLVVLESSCGSAAGDTGRRLRAGARGSNTHGVVIALEDDACGVAGRGTTPVSVLVHDADGAVLRRLRAGLDVSQVVALSTNHAAGTQRTHWREGNI